MAQLVLRDLDDAVKAKLDALAERHGHSPEDEARKILQLAVLRDETSDLPLGTSVSRRFVDIGLDQDEDIPEMRGQTPRTAGFDR